MDKILFDMDWTLYSFENWLYKGSKLEKEVQSNALEILKFFEWDKYLLKFDEIKFKYWEEFSLAFEELYKIKKEDYFNKVWDIQPNKFILNNRSSKEVFQFLKTLWYEIYIVSESPNIWINRVLTFLQVDNLLSWIYSWQWNERKSNGLLYERVKNQIWAGHYMVWDQINSDIIMSKKSWFRPIYISTDSLKSEDAEFNINNLIDLYKIIWIK